LALSRHWKKDLLGRMLRPPLGGGGSRAGMPGLPTGGRVSGRRIDFKSGLPRGRDG
jgi:hypothetical protein